MRSVHPYPVFIPEKSTKLIIGSLPPERFCSFPKQLRPKDVDFYYGSQDNYFWKLLSEITLTNLDYENNEIAINQRKDLLTQLKCGITDIIASCKRAQNSASDSNLKEIHYQPILAYLENTSISTLIYTSHFVQQQVYRYFSEQFGENWKKETLDNRRHKLHFPNGLISDDITLYSPSPQALKGLGKNGKEKRLEQYKSVFKLIK